MAIFNIFINASNKRKQLIVKSKFDSSKNVEKFLKRTKKIKTVPSIIKNPANKASQILYELNFGVVFFFVPK
ncbi:MAG: hypothetical protein ACXADW_18120, partial [Candidatus Hodarchaeales archaeon]